MKEDERIEQIDGEVEIYCSPRSWPGKVQTIHKPQALEWGSIRLEENIFNNMMTIY